MPELSGRARERRRPTNRTHGARIRYELRHFARQQELSREKLVAWAGELSLDVSGFEQCLTSEAKRGLVLAEYEERRRRGVEGTPTFLVNGKKVEGKLLALEKAIAGLLGGSP